MKNGVLLSTPDLRPSLDSIVQGLKDEGLLGCLVTTLAFLPPATGTTSYYLRSRLPRRWRERIRRRTISADLVEITQRIPGREIIRLLAAAYLDPCVTHRVWNWSEKGFDRSVAARFSGVFSHVYGMEHSSLATFKAQKRAGGHCVLRQVNAHGRYLAKVLAEEAERFPELTTRYLRRILKDNDTIVQRKEEEYALSDLIIANSHFARQTFVTHGVGESKVVAVPTGCPPPMERPVRSCTREKLRFLYVGSISLRKGFPYLLSAWSKLAAGGKMELVVAGHNELSPAVQERPAAGIDYKGVVTASELKRLYTSCDVFVLPTLCEGLAHSLLEALSHGLPVVTTPASGCGDLVVDEYNGRIVNPGDADELTHAMQWCVENRKDLEAMGARSLDKAGQWSVEDSNRDHLASLKRLF